MSINNELPPEPINLYEPIDFTCQFVPDVDGMRLRFFQGPSIRDANYRINWLATEKNVFDANITPRRGPTVRIWLYPRRDTFYIEMFHKMTARLNKIQMQRALRYIPIERLVIDIDDIDDLRAQASLPGAPDTDAYHKITTLKHIVIATDNLYDLTYFKMPDTMPPDVHNEDYPWFGLMVQLEDGTLLAPFCWESMARALRPRPAFGSEKIPSIWVAIGRDSLWYSVPEGRIEAMTIDQFALGPLSEDILEQGNRFMAHMERENAPQEWRNDVEAGNPNTYHFGNGPGINQWGLYEGTENNVPIVLLPISTEVPSEIRYQTSCGLLIEGVDQGGPSNSGGGDGGESNGGEENSGQGNGGQGNSGQGNSGEGNGGDHEEDIEVDNAS